MSIRKVFDIYINDVPHPVYDIKGKIHNYGRMNGYSDTYWLYKGKQQNSNEKSLLLELNNKEFLKDLIPYIDKGVHRVCWEINYKQRNSIKYKWDDYSIRSHGLCTLKANNRDVYQFSCSDANYALNRAQFLMSELISHPYDFLNPEKNNGRKIFFYGLPSFVETGYQVGEIKIRPDYEEVSKEKWWEIYDFVSNNNMSKFKDKILTFGQEEDLEMHEQHLAEERRNDTINWGDALSDGHIWWYRD